MHVLGRDTHAETGDAELIIELELWDGDPARLAAQLGITRNNLKVRRHRARRALRQRLEEFCRSCAVHGYPDCPCQHGKGSEAPTGQENRVTSAPSRPYG